MSNIARLQIGIALTLSLVAAIVWFAPAPAHADGAVALGIPADVTADGFSYGYRVNAPNRDQARDTAFDQCSGNKVAPESARKQCVVVADFRNECLAIAMDPKDGTPGYGVAIAPDRATAEARAMGFCRATAGKDRREFCKIDAVACDGRRN